jgi:hypothetical protein
MQTFKMTGNFDHSSIFIPATGPFYSPTSDVFGVFIALIKVTGGSNEKK